MRPFQSLRLPCGLAAGLMLTGAAAAQGVQPAPAGSDWNQAYIGLSAGYAEASDFSIDYGQGFSPALEGEADGGAYGLRLGVDREWSRIEPQGGFNRLVGGLVLDVHGVDIGSETDLDQTSLVVDEPPCGGPDGGSDCEVIERGSAGFDLEHYATLRGRVGPAGDRFYAYVTGGVAYTKVDYVDEVATFYGEDAAEARLNGGQEITASTPLPAGCSSVDEPEPTETPVVCGFNRGGEKEWAGPTIGLGAEYKLSDGVSLGAEYLHMDFHGEGDVDSLTANLNWRF